MSRIPIEDEIKESVWNLLFLKSSGPNRFSSIFYINYWHIIKSKLISFVQECFRIGRIPEAVNKTFLVLIPKTFKASNFNQFCPISLCNFAYKVIAKIISNRLNGVVEKLVSLNQKAFVRGRQIAENSILAHEVIHKVRKHKGNKRG